MKTYKLLFLRVIIITLTSFGYLFAQDSLFLIKTVTGHDIYEPIKYINTIGDINNDGFDEFYIKNLQWKNNGFYGADYFDIYFGSDTFSTANIYHFNLPAELTGSYFNIPIGDINNDGYDDFFFNSYTGTIFPEIKLYLCLGDDGFDSSNCQIVQISGTPTTGGDMNKDGFRDFVSAIPANNMNSLGKVFLYLGGDTISYTPSVTFTSASWHDGFGSSADITGDLNGDGFNDLLVSLPVVSSTNTDPKCNVYFGKEDISNQPDLFFNISEGSNLSYVGDVNGDSFDDFLVSEGTGNPILYFGSENFNASNKLEFTAYKNIDNFGFGFGGIGDINNDGYSDFAINIKNFINSSNIMVSKLNIYLGSSEIDTIPDFSLEGETKWCEFGRMVGNCGDLNGDGFNEFYVLSPNYPNHENPLGKVYIYSMKKFVVGIEEEKTKTSQLFCLYQNYPNPFNPSTTIKYQIPTPLNPPFAKGGNTRGVFISLKIYDVLGREVTTLVNEAKQPGNYEVIFDANNLSSGMYFYELQSGNFRKVKKMLLLR